jgi:hypothetical protein
MISRLGLALAILASVAVAGCSSLGVKPWQRDVLAREEMQLDSIPSMRPSMITCTSVKRPPRAAVRLRAAAADAIEAKIAAAKAGDCAKAIDGRELRPARRRCGAQPGNPHGPSDSGLLEDWSVDSALAYYHEDGRIQAIEPVVDVAKVFADGQALNFNVTFDALSGASPNGALTSRTAQTFASPSGKPQHQYTTAPGQLPVDPDYQDDRIAVGGNWTVPFTRVDQVSVGGKLSAEDDFFSATVNASIAHDFNEKNTTLSFGVDNEFDSIHPDRRCAGPGE